MYPQTTFPFQGDTWPMLLWVVGDSLPLLWVALTVGSNAFPAWISAAVEWTEASVWCSRAWIETLCRAEERVRGDVKIRARAAGCWLRPWLVNRHLEKGERIVAAAPLPQDCHLNREKKHFLGLGIFTDCTSFNRLIFGSQYWGGSVFLAWAHRQ